MSEKLCRRIFGFKRENLKKCRKSHNEELHNMYSDIIRVIKSVDEIVENSAPIHNVTSDILKGRNFLKISTE
jgi:hypothetical protein